MSSCEHKNSFLVVWDYRCLLAFCVQCLDCPHRIYAPWYEKRYPERVARYNAQYLLHSDAFPTDGTSANNQPGTMVDAGEGTNK